MCGITALITQDKNIKPRIEKMTGIIKHRGPDDQGIWINKGKNVALGQRRLSIIDLSPRGHQPMFNEDKTVAITFNGEVYNFGDLKPDLIKKGHQFNSATDTEVIIHSYEEYGPKCVEKFNGMWAFVLYDEKNKKIFASRDRLGIKPLYYYWDGENLVLASEIKAILASKLVKAEVDPEGLSEYFTFQNIISDRTLFANIKMLPAGHNLIFDLKNNGLEIKKYWDLKYEPQDLSEKEFSRLILDAFRRAMDRHLISDVEIGATISGGMDSSAITAITTKYFQNIHTFTGGFDTSDIADNDRSFDEREYARIIAKKFKTEHHERLITHQDIIDTLPQIVWHFEDPKVAMCYTFFLIAKLVSKYVKVVLSGSGGDEAFAGYPWRYSLIENKTDPQEFDKIYYDYWSRLIKDEHKKDFFTKKILANTDPRTPFNEYQKIITAAGNVSPVNKSLYFENKTFLHGMLMVEDKMDMAFSLEGRVPFLDKEMIDLSVKIPDHLKYKNGISKYILKKAFEKILPKEILNKRKQGFTPPDQTWYRRELKDYIHNLLLGPETISQKYINRDYVRRLIAEHNQGTDHRMVLWSLMFFEWWCRIFLEGERISS